MLYYPVERQLYDPKKSGSTPEDVWIRAKDGTELFGWYFHAKSKSPKGLILFFHGNGENLSSHFLSLMWILDHGYDFFIFDYRGYGRSHGNPTPSGTVLDGVAAIQYASSKAPRNRFFIFAQSLGGAIALRSIYEARSTINNLKLITIDSSFPSYQDIGADVLSRHWITWAFQPLSYFLLSDNEAPNNIISELHFPILVAHGSADKVVPIRFGKKIFSLANEPKQFWEVKDGEHTDLFWRSDVDYRKRFLDYIESL